MAMASITHGGKTFRFRTNPNSIRWTYTLITKIDETYGGRVVQILSCNIDDLIVIADAGGGGWDYLKSVGEFFRDMLFDQRQGGAPGVFSYPTRGWEMGIYAVSFPFKDGWNEVRREFTMQFKVQEDISGVVTGDTIAGEIERLKQGIAYEHNDFNTPVGDPGSAAWPTFGDSTSGDGNVDPNAPKDPAPSNTPTPTPPNNSIPILPPPPAPGGNGGAPYFPTPTP